MELRAGALIDRYRVEGRLGAGGTAVVYLVRHEQLGTRYALKVLRVTSPGIRRRLLREGRVQSRLRHPNVVGVLDVVALDGGPGLIMEYVSGPSLASLLSSLRPTPAQVDSVAVDILEGVAAAHRRGMIHRDIKPANVLLAPEAGRLVARVADFGLAKLVALGEGGEGHSMDTALSRGALTRPGVVLGTPCYMAPEQAVDASDVDARADVWALGCVLYELVTGRRLLAPGRALYSLRRGERPEPSLGPGVPPRWERAVRAALRVDRRERPADAGALRALWGGAGGGERAWDPQTLSASAGLAPTLSVGSGSSGAEETFDASELSGDFAPSAVHNLPPEPDEFVGRRTELDALTARLGEGARLLTLHGTAGVGKTRLARRWARASLGAWRAVIWVELAEARDTEGLCFALGRALGLPLRDADPVAQLGAALGARGRCLVLLDNFEGLVDCSAQVLERWLAAAPELHLLVTSRALLRLPQERALPLPPLPPEQAATLYVTRARRVRGRFELSPSRAGAVAELVRLLDGLPLAIELAAARARVMDPAATVARMSRRLELLSGGPGSGGRGGALRAALHGSWELLDAAERSALAQLSVFEGGFDLEAAEAVVALGDGGPWLVDVLQSLADKSLIRLEEDGQQEAIRFNIFLSIQAYAAERLAELGGADAVWERHAAWYGRLGGDLGALDGPGGGAALGRLARELDNLVAAARHGRGEGALRAGLAAARVMSLRGPLSGALALYRTLSERAGDPAERAELLLAAARVAGPCSPPERAAAAVEAALAAARSAGRDRAEGAALRLRAAAQLRAGQLDGARRDFEAALALVAGRDRSEEAAALTGLAGVDQSRGEGAPARARLEAALAAAAASGDLRAEAGALGSLGNLEVTEGRYSEARRRYERALALYRDLGDRAAEAEAMGRLGYLGLYTGDFARARSWLESALSLGRELGSRETEGAMLCNLGSTWLAEGAFGPARQHFEEAVAVSRATGKRLSELTALQSLGNTLRLQGELEAAAELLEQVLAAAAADGDRWTELSALIDLGNVRRLLGALDGAEALLERALSMALEASSPRRVGSAQVALAELALARGDLEGALVRYRSARDAGGEDEPGRRAEGMAATAWVLALLGRIAEARALIDRAEALLPERAVPMGRVEFLACRGRVALAEGRTGEARADMEAAWILAERMGAGARSGIMRRVRALRAALER